MGPRTMGLLVMSSVLNAALSFFVLAFALLATSPAMDDVTMRIGFYVLNAVALAAAAAIFLPWIYVHKQNNRCALFFAFLAAVWGSRGQIVVRGGTVDLLSVTP